MTMRDERPNEVLVLAQRVGQSNHLLHEARGVRDRHHDRPVAAFDPLRQRDLFSTRQERNLAHVGEIHPHNIARRVGPDRCQVGLVRVLARSSVVCPRSLERLRVDVDAGVPRLAEEVIRRRRGVWRQYGVDLLAK